MFASRIVATLILGLACLSGSVLAGSAMADDEVVAATSRPKLPTEAEIAKSKAEIAARPAIKPLTTAEQIEAWHTLRPLGSGDEAPAQKRQIHGEASVSVGTGGYRNVYIASLIPIGENTTLGIAISQTDFGKYGDPYGSYYDGFNGGYYGDYANGYYGGYIPGAYGRPYGTSGYGWNRRGGTQQSISLSLNMNDADKGKPDTPEGCAPGFRDGDRYMEPLWVRQARGSRTCNTTTELR